MNGSTAIAGLGVTEMGKVFGRSAVDFAAEAIALALEDAGLEKGDVDGLLVNWSPAEEMGSAMVQMLLGFEDLSLFSVMNAAGSTSGAMLQYASMAIDAGLASCVVLVYADAPLTAGSRASAAGSYSGRDEVGVPGLTGLVHAYGDFGAANTGYAIAARRHMELFGTTSEQLGQIAVSQRAWAMDNPWAQIKKPLTIEEHQASRFVVEPLHLYDCCLLSNGGVAVVVTAADRARHLRQPPVYVQSVAQFAPGDNLDTAREPAINTGARAAGAAAMKQAGISRDEIDVLELYDCYTYTVLVTLEDYGFCEKGEGGPFVEDGKLGPGGSLPTNTGGGHLSAYYMWGFTPLSEAIVQARGQGGARQVAKNDIVLASGNGGVLNWHSTAILSRHASL